MARPLRLHLPGSYYHVMSRGNDKQPIFLDDGDYERFLELLEKTLGRFKVACLAYCMMGNHYHLLLCPGEVSVSRMMHHLNSSYCAWFNRKHGRVGHLMGGRFTCRHVDSDSYVLTALRYILMNPVTASLATTPDEWRWSSYRATAGLAPRPGFLCVERVWAAFDTTSAALGRHRFVLFTAAATPDAEARDSRLVVGGEAFASRITPLLEPHRETRDFPYAHRFATRPPLTTIFEGRHAAKELREASYDAFGRHAYTLREIGGIVNRAPATVWSWIKKVEACPTATLSELGSEDSPGVRSRFFGSSLL
jgi:putative transposase